MEFLLPTFFDQFNVVLRLLFFTSPLWVPLGLGALFYDLWIQYKREQFFLTQETILLEIRLPQEVLRSPAAMELVLTGLHVTGGEGTWYDRYINGKTRPWFSLEIASIEGHVHFFVWTRKNFKDLVESHFYSQYPGIEIFEVSDYTDAFPFYDPKVDLLDGEEVVLDKLDPYPIKTYVDYGLDKDPKEEYKYDPLTTVLEYMGSIGRGEQMWFQIVCRAHKGKGFSAIEWKKDTEKLIETLSKKFRGEDEKEAEAKPRFRFPLKSETEILDSLHRSMGKIPFDCGLRFIYIAKKDVFKKSRISGVRGFLKPFNSGNLNDFKLNNVASYDFPWEDFRDIRVNENRRKMLSAYRRRSFFYPPFARKYIVLNTEELATIFHFPGQVSQTPLLFRLPSRKAEAPANLPV